MQEIKNIIKRDGREVLFDVSRIQKAIFKAAQAVGGSDQMTAWRLAIQVYDHLKETENLKPTVEEVQDVVEKVLIKNGHAKTAKAYILYRDKRTQVRTAKAVLLNIEKTISEYINQIDWRIKENANIDYSHSGLMLHTAGAVIANYVLNNVYTKEIKDAHVHGFFHIHDLGMGTSGYCAGWSLKQLLHEGFNGPKNKVAAGSAKHFDTALGQMVNFLGTLQNEWSGAQAFNNFDTLLAPYVRADKLSYKEVRQGIQQFIFSVNTTSRWGGQCVDTHTEVLSKEGWKKYNEIKKGMVISTFNLKTGHLEYQPTEKVNIYQYNGEMLKFNGGKLEMLLTPNHRVIKKEENSYKIAPALEIKVPFFVPVVTTSEISLFPITEKVKVPYQGIVWCPTVKNSTFVARRNGTVFITGNSPFTNITLDLTIPEHFKKEAVSYGGKTLDETYASYQKEVDMINRAFVEVMLKGDHQGRIFPFPIPTYNVGKNFDWESENSHLLFEMTAKYGTPYFQNFINSDLNPEDVRSMCCRLSMNLKELRHRTGGLFGSGDETGSLGVVTLNMPRLASLSKRNIENFFELIEEYMLLAKTSLEIKRKMLEDNLKKGLFPYTARYLPSFKNHFSTIGLIGMNEACLNLISKDIATEEGRKLALSALNFMRKKIITFQQETGNLYNLEATPAEGASFRLSNIDKQELPDIITAGSDEAPYYTNSTWLPVEYTDDPILALELQEELQTKYTGGTTFHFFLGEALPNADTCKLLVKRVLSRYRIPYLSVTPTFSVCPKHGYLTGEKAHCPHCGAETEVYSRVVGYYRPVANWNKGKKEEYKHRKFFKLNEVLGS